MHEAGLSPAAGKGRSAVRVGARAVAGLAVEVEGMVRELRLALAEGRAAGSLP